MNPFSTAYFTVICILSVSSAACTSQEDSCVQGQSAPCVCESAVGGAQVCMSATGFGPCVCGTATDGDAQSPKTDAAASGAPTFLSLGMSTTRLTEGEVVIFTAVLTDPDGIDDLIGGSLVSGDASIQYGAFISGAQEGAYALDLGWEQLRQAHSLDFDDEMTLQFRAEFFDVAGHVSTGQLTLVLHCDGDTACDGSCIDLTTNRDRCGACDKGCTGDCADGACLRDCRPAAATNCAAVCADMGLACSAGCPGLAGGPSSYVAIAHDFATCQFVSNYHIASCTESTDLEGLRCCCAGL